jgi:hypothetical protein
MDFLQELFNVAQFECLMYWCCAGDKGSMSADARVLEGPESLPRVTASVSDIAAAPVASPDVGINDQNSTYHLEHAADVLSTSKGEAESLATGSGGGIAATIVHNVPLRPAGAEQFSSAAIDFTNA